MFDCWYDVLFMKCYVGFTPDVTGHIPSKKLNFCRISPQSICPKVLGIIKIFLANVRWAFVYFLVSSGFCLGTLPWMPFFPSLFLIVESWTMTLIETNEACSSLDVVLGSFMTSWMSRRCALGVILVGRPLLGRFITVSPFVDNGSDHGSLESQSLRNGFITLSRLIRQLFCFLSVLEFSLDCGMKCCSLSMLHFVRQVLFKWFLDSKGLAVTRPGFG